MPTPTQPIFTDVSSVGLESQVFASLLLLTSATGGPSGSFVPTQYYNTQGTDSATGFYISIPEGFGFSARLTWVGAQLGASYVENSYIYIKVNGSTVASVTYSGDYAGPIEVAFPDIIVAGPTYQIVSYLAGTGPTGYFWNTLAEPWNTTTIDWTS